MVLRVCPSCDRAFYTISREYCPSCPYCRYVLADRRTHERIRTSVEFSFSNGGPDREATLIDFSTTGARIIYQGQSLPVNMIININIDEVNIHGPAKVVWSQELNLMLSQTGLRLLVKSD